MGHFEMNTETYWNNRAETYNNLNWVKDKTSLGLTLNAMQLSKTDVVLDVGTGTGVVATALSPLVDKVIALDASRGMLPRATACPNIHYVHWDICESLFATAVFDKVVARQVFHHIPKGYVEEVVATCNNVLKSGGILTVVEPVCPSDGIMGAYKAIFELKDGRNVLTAGYIVELMDRVGFTDVKTTTFTIENFSVKNWLDNNALDKEIQDRIFEMHVTASEEFKKAYNMHVVNGDCLIDTKNVIVTGRKI